MITFCYFLTQNGMDKKLVLIFFKFDICCVIDLQFPLRYFYNCKCIPYAKYEKKTLIVPVFLFFHNIGPNLAKILPLRPHPLSFFVDVQWNMLGDSVNINNFCCNPVVLQKLVKPLEIAFWDPVYTTKESA